MASIRFVVDSNEASKLHLSALLHEEKLPDGEIAFDFKDVPEDLALWLLSSVSSLHGLIPEVAPSKTDGPKKESAHVEEKKSEPAPSKAKAKSSEKAGE